jgi:hypothetical protein
MISRITLSQNGKRGDIVSPRLLTQFGAIIVRMVDAIGEILLTRFAAPIINFAAAKRDLRRRFITIRVTEPVALSGDRDARLADGPSREARRAESQHVLEGVRKLASALCEAWTIFKPR